MGRGRAVILNHDLTHEQFFECPYCWREVSLVLDLSVREQTYIEDCENCCNPIRIRYVVEDGDIIAFSAESIEQ